MGIMLRMRTLPAGFTAPCLPTKTDKLRQAANGCMRSNMTASASLPARRARAGQACGRGNAWASAASTIKWNLALSRV